MKIFFTYCERMNLYIFDNLFEKLRKFHGLFKEYIDMETIIFIYSIIIEYDFYLYRR